MTPLPSDLLTTREAGFLLHMSAVSVTDLIRTARLEAERVLEPWRAAGFSYRVTRANVERYRQRKRSRVPAPPPPVPTTRVLSHLSRVHAALQHLPTAPHVALAMATVAQALDDAPDMPAAAHWLSQTGKRWLELLGADDTQIARLETSA